MINLRDDSFRSGFSVNSCGSKWYIADRFRPRYPCLTSVTDVQRRLQPLGQCGTQVVHRESTQHDWFVFKRLKNDLIRFFWVGKIKRREDFLDRLYKYRRCWWIKIYHACHNDWIMAKSATQYLQYSNCKNSVTIDFFNATAVLYRVLTFARIKTRISLKS